MTRRTQFLAAMLAFAVWLTPGTGEAEIIDRIVARVNNDVLTLHDVRQAAIPFVLQEGMDPAVLDDASRRGQLHRDVLKDLIDRNLLVQEATKLELQISDAELNQYIMFTYQQQGLTEDQFKEQIESYGMRYPAYRDMVRQNLLKIRMIRVKVGSQVNVTEADVDQVFRERYGTDPGAERYVTVSHMLFPPTTNTPEAHAEARERADAAMERLNAGEAFEDVAKTSNDGPTAAKGGFLGTFRRGELDGEFEAVAFAMSAGEVSEVVQTKFGYHIILVSNVEERATDENDQRRAMIFEELQQRAMQTLLDQYLKTLRSRAFVDVRY